MANRNNFSDEEWQLLADAPEYVYAAVQGADGKEAALTTLRESRHFKKSVSDYEGGAELVRAIIADDSKAGRAVKRSTLSEAEDALNQVNALLEKNTDREEADSVRDFLMHVANTIAEAAGERILGIGDNVSKREAKAIERVADALKATEAHKAERVAAEERKAAAEAKAKREAEERAKQAAAEVQAKREAEAKAKREEEERQRKEAAEKARKEREAEERKAEAERQRAEAAAKVEAARKALEEKRAKEEAEKAAEEARQAAEEARQAAEEAANPYMGEYTVVSGDNLSYISKKFYGSPNHWKEIYEANKDVIGDNPSLIRVGQTFKIPKLS